MVKVVFIKDLNDIKAGESKDVRPGYARNYLFPRGLAALSSDPLAVALIAQKQRAVAEKTETASKVAQEFKSISGQTFTFTKAVSEEGKLFGSLTAGEVAKELNAFLKSKDAQTTVQPKDITFVKPVKVIGKHEASVKAGETSATLTIEVVAQENKPKRKK